MNKRVNLLIGQISGNYRFCKDGAIKESYDHGNFSYPGSVYIDNLLISNRSVNYSRSEVGLKHYKHYPPEK